MAEALGVGGVGGVQGGLALGADLAGGAEVDAGWGVQPDAGVAVLVGEEPLRERAGVGQGPEALGEDGAYFKVLNAASLNGVSLDTCGREWDRAATVHATTKREKMSSTTYRS